MKENGIHVLGLGFCQVDFFFILLIWKADFFYLSSPLLPNAKLTSHLKCIFGKLDFGKNSM